jgi:HSP20 family protein
MALSYVLVDPFFSDEERNLNRALQRAFRSGSDTLPKSSNLLRHAVDVVETKEAFKVVTDAPGFSPEDIKVELHEGRLTVTGERKVEKEAPGADGKFHVQERHFTKFTRQFQLPANVAEDQVGASLDKGILTVTVPKVPEPPKPEPKRIRVTSTSAGQQE